MGSVPSAAVTERAPWHGTAWPWCWPGGCDPAEPQQPPSTQKDGIPTPACHHLGGPGAGHRGEGVKPGGALVWEGEGRRGHPHGRLPWHPILTAGPQQLVQDGQHVQAYLENEVGEEEEDAGPQQSFEEAAGVTCKTRAPHYPSPEVTLGCTSIPSGEPAPSRQSWEGVHWGSALGTGSHQDLACLTVHPSAAKEHPFCCITGETEARGNTGSQGRGTTLPPLAPAAPSHLAGTGRFPAPLHQDRHRDAAHHPHPDPWWNVLWGGAGGPPHRKSRQTFHQLQPCPYPTQLPGPCARFPGHGTGSEPTAAARRLGGGPGPKTLPPLVFFL